MTEFTVLTIPAELLLELLWVSTWALVVIWFIYRDGRKIRAAARSGASGRAGSPEVGSPSAEAG